MLTHVNNFQYKPLQVQATGEHINERIIHLARMDVIKVIHQCTTTVHKWSFPHLEGEKKNPMQKIGILFEICIKKHKKFKYETGWIYSQLDFWATCIQLHTPWLIASARISQTQYCHYCLNKNISNNKPIESDMRLFGGSTLNDLIT